MKKLISLFVFLAANTLLFSQLYEIPLSRKIDESHLIVEGTVIESQSYIGNDDRVYTAHKVEISMIFKKTDFRESHLTIVTRGGQVDDRTTTWTHLLSLEAGETGIFFLKKSSYPKPAIRYPGQVFEVFSSTQGFLKYVDGLEGRYAVTQFQRYGNIEDELVRVISFRTGENPKMQTNNPLFRNGALKGGVSYTRWSLLLKHPSTPLESGRI